MLTAIMKLEADFRKYEGYLKDSEQPVASFKNFPIKDLKMMLGWDTSSLVL